MESVAAAEPPKVSPKSRLSRMVLLALGGVITLLILGKTCAGDPTKTDDPAQGKSRALPEKPLASDGFDELSIGHEYKTSVASQSHRVSTLEQEVGVLKKTIDDLRGQLGRANAGQETELARLDELSKLLQSLPSMPRNDAGPSAPGAGLAPENGGREPSGVRLVTFDAPARKGPPPHLVRIPTASAGEATVLNGVFAGVSGEPSPVRFRLDAALVGPSASRVPLRNAFLIGKASGNANASRVHVELVSFSTVKTTGESVEVPVRGYVEGVDGMEGIPGTYLYRVEDQLPLVILGEGASGFANALADSQTTSSITPLGGAVSVVSGNTLKFGGLKAASGTSQKIAEIFAERMKEIHPAVWTPAFGRVKAIFLEGVTLPDFLVEELNDGERSPFRGLDLHR